VVRRADSSGTTYVFTRHLAAVSERWKRLHGSGKKVLWPRVNHMVAAPKNDGVMATIKQTPGAVGYVEYGFARHAEMPMAILENASGYFVAPDLQSGMAALASAELPPDLRVWIDDPGEPDAYPIVTFSWLLLYRKYEDSGVAASLRSLVKYCLDEGQAIADRMGYIPLPYEVSLAVRSALDHVH
jgi:phosphate transport system substrate-binding protein